MGVAELAQGHSCTPASWRPIQQKVHLPPPCARYTRLQGLSKKLPFIKDSPKLSKAQSQMRRTRSESTSCGAGGEAAVLQCFQSGAMLAQPLY